MPELLLALDAGTTSARALLMDAAGRVLAIARQPLVSHFPAPGQVEQDAEAVWRACRQVMQRALADGGRAIGDVAAIGITTQRASLILWDRATGQPVAPMLVWSDLRGMARYRELRAAGFACWPQVPAAKLEAALALVDDGRARAERGELCWGTLDSFLLYRLSGGSVHATDISAAWLTGYIEPGGGWNEALIDHQRLPRSLFPEIVDSWGAIGVSDPDVLGAAVPITALLADQQAGLFAHGSLAKGSWKATYGTSGVLIASTGETPLWPHRTMPMQALARRRGRQTYCIEGMIVTAGSFIDWLCGDLGLFDSPAALEAAARSVASSEGVRIRPSLQGLGAPHGRFDARALIAGLSFAAGPAHLARAALEALAFRIREIAETIAAIPELEPPAGLPVDGGCAQSDLLMQIQADLLGRPVRRHAVREGTAYGAAVAAGLGLELLAESDLPGLARYEREFEPAISRDEADARYEGWAAAVLSPD